MAETLKIEKLHKYVRDKMVVHPSSQYDRALLQASDPVMELPTRADFEALIDAIRPDMPTEDDYGDDGAFDCDDFGFILKGLYAKWMLKNRPRGLPYALGVGWGSFGHFGDGGYHALNWVVLGEDRKIYWIEPQFIAKKPLEECILKFKKSRDRVTLLVV